MTAPSWLRTALGAVLLVLVAFALGYGTALRTRPAKVVTQVQTQTVYKDRIIEHQAKDRIVYRNVVRTVTVDRKPTGEVTTTTTIADHSTDKTDVRANIDDRSDGALSSNSTSVTVNARADWRVSALVGAELSLKAPYFSGPAYGVEVDRRIIGPIWVGLWGLRMPSGSSGVVGISLSGEF